MDGGTSDTNQLSADEIIRSANEQQFHTLSALRVFLRKTITTWDLLETAPRMEIPGRIVPPKRGTREQPQGSLALQVENNLPAVGEQSPNQLTLPSWFLDASRKSLSIIFAQLQARGEEQVAVITREGEEVIRELVRLQGDHTLNTAITVKTAASTAQRRHFSLAAQEMREYQSFREFDSFQELESYLRLRCPFLYCLGIIFLHSHRVLKGIETFLCFSSPLSQNRGLVIAKRNKTSRKVEITAEGIACITHPQASKVHWSVENNIATGSNIIHQVHQAYVRGPTGSSQLVPRFSSLEEAAAYLSRLPRLRHLPYIVGNNTAFVKYGRGKQFKLLQAFDNNFVERGELSALHANYFDIIIALDELAALAELEKEPLHMDGRKRVMNQRQIVEHRRKTIERLITMLTGAPVHLAKPEQPTLDFGVVKS